jgi:choline dehydrogenase-like flavoprotein
MIHDGRIIPNGAKVEADICVVGAGPAGMSIALQLIDEPGVQVALIESGGLEWDQRTQDLSNAEVKGQKYYPVTETHLRVFGGSSLSYGGVSTDLGEIDFLERPWVPESGWPFTKDALDPYRQRADEIMGVNRVDSEDSVGANPGGTKWETVPLSRPLVRFGKKYRETIENASNIAALLHSTVTKLEVDQDASRITGAIVKTFAGNSYRVNARLFVLAGGGIEIPRLLLASNDVMKAGIGNAYDNVGRYFQEHPRIIDCYELPEGTRDLADQIAGAAGTLEFSRLALTDEVMRDEQLLNYLANVAFGFAGQHSEQWYAVRRIGVTQKDPWRDSPYFQGIGDGRSGIRWSDVKTAMMRPDLTALSLAGVLLRPRSLRRWVEIISGVEQVPRRDNRVVLTTERDELGMPRIELQWKLDELEERTYLRGRELVLEELDRLIPGLSGNRMPVHETWPDGVMGTWHHAGTTRMNNDPQQGVVDSDSKVHGMDNLYVTGSSVMPTSGATAPTYTIVSLALRLADHVKQRLAHGQAPAVS